ncbi:MAG: hypothetical protein ACE5G7_04410 [Candidatus Hydrothermarchaeaceae archaeon]
MAKFEYSLLNVEAIRSKGMITFEGLLNKRGKDGWELVGIDGDLYIFKRKIE